MTTPKLPSAEERAAQYLYGEYLTVQRRAADAIRADRRAVLEEAAQAALDHPEAPAEAILKLREN